MRSRRLFSLAIPAGIIFVGLVLASSGFGDRLRKVVLRMQGYSVICDLPELVVEFQAGSRDMGGVARCSLENLTGEPIQIVGIEASCPCVSALDLPVTIPAHSTGCLQMQVDVRCDNDEPLRFAVSPFFSVAVPRPSLALNCPCVGGVASENADLASPIPDPMFAPVP